MPMSRNIGTYLDCQAAMDAALKHGEVRRKCTSKGQAVNFRMRCYTLRKILFERQEKAFAEIPGASPSTPYDELEFVLDGEYVILRPKSAGHLELPDGTRIEPPRPDHAPEFEPVDDDFLAGLRKQFGVEE